MDELILKTFVVGNLQNNCYLVFKQKSKEAFLIDCPVPLDALDQFVQEKKLKLLFIALTHAHFDHIEGLGKQTVPFYLHKDDAPLLNNPQLNGSLFFNYPVAIDKEPGIYQKDSKLLFGDSAIEVIHTPGHTPGSVSLRLNKWLFSGDALFFDSVGRTDIPLASHELLVKSIKERLLTLPEDTLVYPGHGSSTSIGREKQHNPFL